MEQGANSLPEAGFTSLEKAIAYVSPKWAAKRLQSRMQMSIANQFYGSFGSYDGASVTRRETNTWIPFGSDADTASVFDLPALRARSRDALRNQPLALGAVNTTVTNVVGPGLNPHPSIDAEYLGMTEAESDAWRQQTLREWALWAETHECDLYRTQNFAGLQDLAFRSCLENGDTFALMPRKYRPGSPYALKVQLVEADRISNPNFALNTTVQMAGIQKDPDGVPVGCHVQKQHPGAMVAMNSQIFAWDYYPFFGVKTGERQVIHLMKKTRIGLTRGIPFLAAVIEPLKMLGRYKQAELNAAVVSAMFSVFIKTEGGQGMGNLPLAPGAAPVVTYGHQHEAPAQQDIKLGNGAIVELGPGESIEIADPKRPNTAFDGFVEAVLKQIGVALELPMEVLLKHYSSSYSAARAAILDAWKMFQTRREWLADCFCQPIWESWLAEAVASGRVVAPGFFNDPLTRRAYSNCMWIGMPKGHIDEAKEIAAAEKRMALGITTGEEETLAYSGTSWTNKQPQRVKERLLREQAGLPTPGVTVRDTGSPPVTPDPKLADEVQGGESA